MFLLFPAAALILPDAGARDRSSGHDVIVTVEKGRPTVDVTLNDSTAPARFLLDTAAGATVIDASLAQERNVMASSIPGAIVVGATGSTGGVQLAALDQLGIGGASIRGLKVVLRPMNAMREKIGLPIEGILGNDVLRQYAVLFDASQGKVSLEDADRISNLGRATCVPNARPATSSAALAGFPIVQVTAATSTATTRLIAIIDTGAPSTVINSAAAQALGVKLPAVATGKAIEGFAANKLPSITAPIGSIAIADRSIEKPDVTIADLPVFAHVGASDQPLMILGMNVLGNIPFAIDRGAANICLPRAR